MPTCGFNKPKTLRAEDAQPPSNATQGPPGCSCGFNFNDSAAKAAGGEEVINIESPLRDSDPAPLKGPLRIPPPICGK